MTDCTLSGSLAGLHLSSDGRLIKASTVYDEPGCGGQLIPENFDMETFANCPRSFIAAAGNPETMEVEHLATGPSNAEFSDVTMAIQVDDETWLGTFAGDRIAYRSTRNRN